MCRRVLYKIGAIYQVNYIIIIINIILQHKVYQLVVQCSRGVSSVVIKFLRHAKRPEF